MCYKFFFIICLLILTVGVSAYAAQSIEIHRYNKTKCYEPGEKIIIYGKGFESREGKVLVVGGHGISVDINKVGQWGESKIVAILPADAKIKKDKRYYIGVQKSNHGEWLSNIDKPLTFCNDVKELPPLVPLKISTKKLVPTVPVRTRNKRINELSIGPRSDDGPRDIPRDDPESSGDRGVKDVDGKYSREWDEWSEEWDDDSYDGGEPQRQRSQGSLRTRSLAKAPTVKESKLSEKSANSREHQEIVLASADMQAAQELATQLADYGISVKRRKHHQYLGVVISVFRVNEDNDVLATLNAIRRDFPDLWIDANQRYSLLESQGKNTAAYGQVKWGKQQSSCAKNLTLGLIDTAVAQHPALQHQKITHKSFLSAGVKAAPADHGTAIAGLMVGHDRNQDIYGLLPNASLYAASVFREREQQQVDTSAELIISALNWLVGKDVQVINLSFGGPRNLILELVLKKLIASQYIVISSAGISAQDDTALYPAAQPGVLAVSAVDVRGRVLNKAIKGDYIDFVAPGVDIWVAATNAKGKYASGSSFAAPFVTAAAAILNAGGLSAYDSLRQYAQDLGEKGKDKQFGWGLINVAHICH